MRPPPPPRAGGVFMVLSDVLHLRKHITPAERTPEVGRTGQSISCHARAPTHTHTPQTQTTRLTPCMPYPTLARVSDPMYVCPLPRLGVHVWVVVVISDWGFGSVFGIPGLGTAWGRLPHRAPPTATRLMHPPLSAQKVLVAVDPGKVGRVGSFLGWGHSSSPHSVVPVGVELHPEKGMLRS